MKELGWRYRKERKQPGKEVIKERYGRKGGSQRERDTVERGGDMTEQQKEIRERR